MRDEKKVFLLIGEASATIYPLARDLMRPLFEKYFSEQRFYQPTFMAFLRNPEPISADLVLRRSPYANPSALDDTLKDAAEVGYLIRDGKSYSISEKGLDIISEVHEAFYERVNQIHVFPADKLEELTRLLETLVDAISQTQLPEGLFCFETSHRGHPHVTRGTLAHVDQLLDDLTAFRDDAHISAWKPLMPSGHLLEVLTFVWNGEGNTAKILVDKMPYRSYQAKDYQKALTQLEEKGWIEKVESKYQVTPEGKKIRDEIEEVTDKNYFSPWEVFTDQQLERLGSLLEDLAKTNKPLIETE